MAAARLETTNVAPVRSFQGLAGNHEAAESIIRWAESSSEPVLFPGLLKDWPAVSRWRGSAGLRHLEALAGEADVQVRP